MTRVNIAELRDQLSKHLRAVENGAEVVVTDRDRPIARLTPYSSDDNKIVMIPRRKPFDTIRTRRFRPSRWKVSSTELLLEERQRQR